VSVKEGTPTLGSVYLFRRDLARLSSSSISAIRYKPAALIGTLVAGTSGVAVAGFFALSRLAVTPLVSIGIIATTLLAYILSIFILAKEKELTHESRERDKSTLDFKAKMLLGATGKRLAIWSSIA
jgi:hypothetical protein